LADAVFQGTYSDWKLVKTRSVVQIVIEVPLEQAQHVYQVLGGMPQPGAEMPVAVARLASVAQWTERPDPSGEVAGSNPAGGANLRSDGSTRHDLAPSVYDQASGAPGQGKPRTPTIKQAWSSLKLAARAGIICNDPAMWQWIGEHQLPGYFPKDGDAAAQWLRERTAVLSRKEYDADPAASRRYLEIERAFLSDKATAGRYGDGP
jgi:hypothetical protein